MYFWQHAPERLALVLPMFQASYEEMVRGTLLWGVEMEWIIARDDKPVSLPYGEAEAMKEALKDFGGVEREVEAGQWELGLSPVREAAEMVRRITEAKQIIRDFCRARGFEALMEAKPLEDHAGNGLHIHISLHDEEGDSFFFRDVEGEYSDALRWSLGGLLALLPSSMPCFAPSPDSYRRFCPDGRSPTHVCWGFNNRTAAVRLPAGFANMMRIEHRVPGVDANPAAALFAILLGLAAGYEDHEEPPEKLFGNAYDPQYQLSQLPQGPEESLRLCEEDGRLLNVWEHLASACGLADLVESSAEE